MLAILASRSSIGAGQAGFALLALVGAITAGVGVEKANDGGDAVLPYSFAMSRFLFAIGPFLVVGAIAASLIYNDTLLVCMLTLTTVWFGQILLETRVVGMGDGGGEEAFTAVMGTEAGAVMECVGVVLGSLLSLASMLLSPELAKRNGLFGSAKGLTGLVMTRATYAAVACIGLGCLLVWGFCATVDDEEGGVAVVRRSLPLSLHAVLATLYSAGAMYSVGASSTSSVLLGLAVTLNSIVFMFSCEVAIWVDNNLGARQEDVEGGGLVSAGLALIAASSVLQCIALLALTLDIGGEQRALLTAGKSQNDDRHEEDARGQNGSGAGNGGSAANW